MRWIPFVSRERYDEVVAMKDRRIAELESERQKLWDVLAYNAINMTIFDKNLIPQMAEEPEPKPEDEIDNQFQHDKARLKSLMRTRPSHIGPALSSIHSRNVMERAKAAHPVASVPGRPEVAQIFQQARQEVS